MLPRPHQEQNSDDGPKLGRTCVAIAALQFPHADLRSVPTR